MGGGGGVQILFLNFINFILTGHIMLVIAWKIPKDFVHIG